MSLPATGPPNWGSAEGVRSYDGPAVVYDWFEFDGPLVETWPPMSQQRLFGEKSINDVTENDISELLLSFSEQASRRPITDSSEIDPYLAIAKAEHSATGNIEEALIAGYKAILCSPDFLFLGLEGNRALASRLSYFLWNTMPDTELQKLSASGELAKPKTLLAQVDRMLSDPRSDRFIEHFLDGWLEMSEIDFTTPDPQLYPEFDPWLRDSMLEETRAMVPASDTGKPAGHGNHRFRLSVDQPAARRTVSY